MAETETVREITEAEITKIQAAVICDDETQYNAVMENWREAVETRNTVRDNEYKPAKEKFHAAQYNAEKARIAKEAPAVIAFKAKMAVSGNSILKATVEKQNVEIKAQQAKMEELKAIIAKYQNKKQ